MPHDLYNEELDHDTPDVNSSGNDTRMTSAQEAATNRQLSENALSRTDEKWDAYFGKGGELDLIKKQLDAAGWNDGYFTPKLVVLFHKLDKMIPPLGLDVDSIKKNREKEAQLLKEKYKNDKKSYDELVAAATKLGYKPGDPKWKEMVGEEPNDILNNNIDSILEAEKTWEARKTAYQERLTEAAKKGLAHGSDEWSKVVGPPPKKYQTSSIVNGGSEAKDIQGAAEAVEQLGTEPLTYDEAARKIGLGILTEDTDLFQDLDKLLKSLDVQYPPFIKDIGADLDKLAKKIEEALKRKIAAFENNIKQMFGELKDNMAAYWNDIMVTIKTWVMLRLPKYPIDLVKYAAIIAVKKVYNDIKAIKGLVKIVLERTQEYILFVTYLTEALTKKFLRTIERVNEAANKITEQVDRNVKLFADEINNTMENAMGIVAAAGDYQKRLIGLKDEAIAKFKAAAKNII